MEYTATPLRFNSRNRKAKSLLTGFNNAYKAQAAKRKNTAETRSPVIPIRNCHSEAIMFRAVVAASPNTISGERPSTSAGIVITMYMRYSNPAILAVLLSEFIFYLLGLILMSFI